MRPSVYAICLCRVDWIFNKNQPKCFIYIKPRFFVVRLFFMSGLFLFSYSFFILYALINPIQFLIFPKFILFHLFKCISIIIFLIQITTTSKIAI